MRLFFGTTLWIPVLLLALFDSARAQHAKAAKDYEIAVGLFNSGQYRLADSLFSVSIQLEAHPDSYYSRAICRKKLGLDSLYCRDLCNAALLRDQESSALFNKGCGRSDTTYFSAYGTSAGKEKYVYYTVHYFFEGSSQVYMAKYNLHNQVIYFHSYDSCTSVTDTGELPAEFKGGTTALYKFVSEHLKVPGQFQKTGRSEIVKVRFLVSKDGRVLDTEIKEGLPGCPDCEKEAIRLVQHMPPWKPAQSRGRKVSMYFLLPVPFR